MKDSKLWVVSARVESGAMVIGSENPDYRLLQYNVYKLSEVVEHTTINNSCIEKLIHSVKIKGVLL